MRYQVLGRRKGRGEVRKFEMSVVPMRRPTGLYVAGENYFLPGGIPMEVMVPTAVPNTTGIIEAHGGRDRSCYVKSDGTAYMVGYEFNDEGDAFEGNVNTIPMQGIAEIRSYGSGGVIRATGGDVYVIGSNQSFQLGEPSEDIYLYLSVPEKIEALSNIKQVISGYLHSLAIDNAGDLYECGHIDPWTTKTTWQKTSGISNIVMGDCCEHSLMVISDGTVMGSGNNEDYQLGTDEYSYYTEFFTIPGVSGAVQVSTGETHSLILLGNGTVLVSGDNSYGQIGLGSSSPGADAFVPIPGVSGIKSISAGDSHSLLLREDGKVLVMGGNFCNELGLGEAYDGESIYDPTILPSLSNVVQIHAGYYQSLFIVEE